MIKAVLDSSVLISAFLTPYGTSALVLTEAKRGSFALWLSPFILSEVRTSLLEKSGRIRRYYAYADEQIDEYVGMLSYTGRIVSKLPALSVVVLDPKDDAVVATAVAAQADYLVSGDSHLLSLAHYQAIAIVPPRDFLTLLEGGGRGEQTPASGKPHAPRD